MRHTRLCLRWPGPLSSCPRDLSARTENASGRRGGERMRWHPFRGGGGFGPSERPVTQVPAALLSTVRGRTFARSLAPCAQRPEHAVPSHEDLTAGFPRGPSPGSNHGWGGNVLGGEPVLTLLVCEEDGSGFRLQASGHESRAICLSQHLV